MENETSKLSSKPMFATTVDYCDYEKFGNRFHSIVKPRVTLSEELASINAILKAGRTFPLLLMDSSSGRIHPDVLATILINLWLKKDRPMIIFMGCMWQKDAGLAGLIEKALIRLADRVIQGYAVQATEEIKIFSETWGIPLSKIRLCKYYYTLTDADMIDPPPSGEDFIFAGGNSHRDYDTLIQAAGELPDLKFVFATNVLDGRTLPPNIKTGLVPRAEFMRLMQVCQAIVTPLKTGLSRAAGQQTYLNAMFLKKPMIVNDAYGVRDHVVDHETGLIVDGTAKGYVEALRYITDPENKPAVDAMCENARLAVMEHSTFENHAARLIEIVDEFYDEHTRGLK
jgi:glycosyltransferase involved in cell wall biosynthesis